jgi:hypothetical protein
MPRFVLFLTLLAVPASPAVAQVTVVRTFEGMNGPNPAPISGYSSDMMAGVSPTYLVGFINAGFSVRLKSDGSLVQPVQTLDEFWSTAFRNAAAERPDHAYDPRIFYDPLSRRWFATSDALIAEGQNRGGTRHMLLAVSADEDPTHPWKAVDVQAKVEKDVDNLKLGLDRNGVYLTGLVWTDEKTIPVVAIPKADLLWSGNAVPSLAHANHLAADKAAPDPARGTHGSRGDEGMIPAFDLNPDKNPGDPTILINRFQSDWAGETAIQIRKVTWTSPTTAVMSGPIVIGLGVTLTEPTTQAMQPPLPQAGLVSPPIRPGGGRLVNAVVSRGSVWAIAATQVGSHTGAFWVEIDLKTMTLAQRGTVGDPAADIVFASANVDGHGNLGIAMNRMSATEYPSIWVTGRLASDPPNALRPMVRAVEGRHVFIPLKWDLSKPGNGTGYMDYSTVVVDPSDSSLFWTYQEVTTNDCLPVDPNGGRFGTSFVAFRVSGGAR